MDFLGVVISNNYHIPTSSQVPCNLCVFLFLFGYLILSYCGDISIYSLYNFGLSNPCIFTRPTNSQNFHLVLSSLFFYWDLEGN